jgi:hypothetical protein
MSTPDDVLTIRRALKVEGAGQDRAHFFLELDDLSVIHVDGTMFRRWRNTAGCPVIAPTARAQLDELPDIVWDGPPVPLDLAPRRIDEMRDDDAGLLVDDFTEVHEANYDDVREYFSGGTPLPGRSRDAVAFYGYRRRLRRRSGLYWMLASRQALGIAWLAWPGSIGNSRDAYDRPPDQLYVKHGFMRKNVRRYGAPDLKVAELPAMDGRNVVVPRERIAGVRLELGRPAPPEHEPTRGDYLRLGGIALLPFGIVAAVLGPHLGRLEDASVAAGSVMCLIGALSVLAVMLTTETAPRRYKWRWPCPGRITFELTDGRRMRFFLPSERQARGLPQRLAEILDLTPQVSRVPEKQTKRGG